MPRQARPLRHPTRGVWYANIGERDEKGRAREVFAPAEISLKDEAGAWEWFNAEKARRAVESVPVPVDVTVEAVGEHYLAWAERRRDEGKLAATEYRNKARHLGIFSDTFGARVVSSLSPDDVTAFAEGLVESYSPVYARNVCATARAALNWAAKKGSAPDGGRLIDVNPIRGFKAPTIPRSPARYAERAEAAAFIGYWRTRKPRKDADGEPLVASQYDRLTLLLERCLIRTGARPKELCLLQWPDIHWDGWRDKCGHVGAKAIIPPDRWKAGHVTGKPRTIYFTPALTRALRRLHDRWRPHAKWVFVHRPGRGGRGADQPWPDGSTLSTTVRRVRTELMAEQEATRARLKRGETVKPWEARRAGAVVREEGHDRLVNYRWRHTAISTLLMLGVDVPTVAELTGTSPDMIYKHYGHLVDSHLAAAADKLVGMRRKTVKAG